jgi:hypothetical protein
MALVDIKSENRKSHHPDPLLPCNEDAASNAAKAYQEPIDEKGTRIWNKQPTSQEHNSDSDRQTAKDA